MKHLTVAALFCGCALVEIARGQAAGISYVYGNGQMGLPLATIAPIVVFVYDKDGKPVANSPVTWTVTQGAPGFFNPPPQTTLSDSNGYAMSYLPAYEVDPSLSFVSIEVVARGEAGGPVKFEFTSLATTLSTEVLKPSDDQNLTINTTVGAIERAGIQVAISAEEGPQAGQPIPNIGLRLLNMMPGRNMSGFYDFTMGNDPKLPSATCLNNTLSDANGTATCDMQIGPRTGTTKLYVLLGENRVLPVLTLNVGVGAPALLSITGGSGQSGSPGATLPVPLQVQVADAGGNPVPNAAVTWSVISGSASVAVSQTITDLNGDAANRVTLGAIPGSVRIRAQTGAAVFVDFVVSVVLGVSNLQVVSGDNQFALTGTVFPNALVVRAIDRNGAPVVGIPVSFAITGGSGSLSAFSVVTDALGFARVTVLAGPDPGPLTVVAAAQGFQAVFQKLAVYAPGPRLSAEGIRNSASGEPGLSPCGLATLTAFGLAPGVDGVIHALDPAATTLGPVDSIAVGGALAVIREVSNVEGREAVVVQTPCGTSTGPAAGPTEVAATVQGLTARVAGVPVAPFQPGVFEVDDNGQKVAWATHGDGTLVNSTSPAVRGEVIRIFATGLGAVVTDPPLPEIPLLVSLTLGINDAGVPQVGSGYLTGQPGLYFVEVAIPADLAVVPARFVIGVPGASGSGGLIYSNTVAIPVR